MVGVAKPDGLVVRHVQDDFGINMSRVTAAADQVKSAKGEGRLVSVGLDYNLLRRTAKYPTKPVEDWESDYPQLEKLLKDCMREFGHPWEDSNRINIILNTYDSSASRTASESDDSSGASKTLNEHKDSFDFFEDRVYGLIVSKDEHAPPLTFCRASSSGESQDVYPLAEQPGSVFYIEDDARYVWKHGCAVGDGRRVSITWRWVRTPFKIFTTLRDDSYERERWICNFIDAVQDEALLSDYLFDPKFSKKSEGGDMRPQYSSYLFKDHNEQCGPRVDRSLLDSRPFTKIKERYDVVLELSHSIELENPSVETSDPRVNKILALRDIWDRFQPHDSDSDLAPTTPLRRSSATSVVDDITPARPRGSIRSDTSDGHHNMKRQRTK